MLMLQGAPALSFVVFFFSHFGFIGLLYLRGLFYMYWAQDDGILVIPTTAYLPPKLGSKDIFAEDYQNCMFSLLSIASMSGCCQVKFSYIMYVRAYCSGREFFL